MPPIGDSIMATGPVDVAEPLEAEETGKKKSKFQTFKNFFAKKKKKEPSSPRQESELKPSQSSTDVSTPKLDSSLPAEPGSKGSMGSKALSHDSVFILESLPDMGGKASSHEHLPGKVKALQLQLQENLRLGSPPLVIASKKTEDAGTVSEDDGLPRSPPEISTLRDVLSCPARKSSNPVKRQSSLSLGGTDSEDDQISTETHSRPVSPLSSPVLVSPASPTCYLLPADFDTPASPLACLDASAARHRIAIKPRKQKAVASKSRSPAVAKKQRLATADGQTSHTISLDKADGREEKWKGASIQNGKNLSENCTNDALAVIKTSDPLRYSWKAVPGADGRRSSAPDDCLEAGDRGVSCLNVESSVTKRDSEMEDERAKIIWNQSDDTKRNSQNSRKEVVEISGPLHTETEAVVLCDTLVSSLCSNGAEKDLGVAAESIDGPCPQTVDRMARDSKGGNNAMHVDRAGDGSGGGNSCVILESRPVLCVLPCFLSALEAPSDPEKATVLVLENHSVVKDGVVRSAGTELPSFEDRVKSTAPPQTGSATLQTHLGGLCLQSTEDEKLFHHKDVECLALNSSLGSQEANNSETTAKSSLSHSNAREDQLGNVTTCKKIKSPDEAVKTQLKSVSAKPVRFTIAPAWQRSLSGGSSSVESSCPQSSLLSAIQPELFEGIPSLETDVQGSQLGSLERSAAASSNPATGRSSEEAQSCETPFGIKLRRTSSLLKYQTEQQHHEPPKQVPLAPSGTSSTPVKDDSKPLQNLAGSAKSAVQKSGVPEEKGAFKVTAEEVAAKQQTERISEKNPTARLDVPSCELGWTSVVKLKQKGVQGHPVPKGLVSQEKSLVKGEQRAEKSLGVSHREKQTPSNGAKSLQKTSPPEDKVPSKTPGSAKTVAPVRSLTQEVSLVEKETRQLPSFPLSPCSSAEPPWLSLAKKKAKAWSEMPQIVQ